MLLVIPAWLLFGLGCLLSDKFHLPVLFCAAGAALFFGLVAYARIFAFRCPQCSKSLGHLADSGGLFSFSAQVQYCPFCGLDLAKEATE